MADEGDFEDDLFDDLYADEAPGATETAAAAPKPSEPAPIAEKAAAPADPAPALQDNAYDEPYQAGGNEDEYEDDDDVDFNLGNGGGSGVGGGNNTAGPAQQAPDTPSYDNAPAQMQESHRPVGSKEDGKMFIGGLNWDTTDDSMNEYFSQFGEVVECTVMRDGATGQSRGFGFLTFRDPKVVNTVMVKEHFLDGKIIDPKRAIPRDEQEKTSKIFVGGVSQDTTDAEFREFFNQFGRVVDATLMMNKDTGRPRGFGFVTFESEVGVDNCLAQDLYIHGKQIEAKRAERRGAPGEEDHSRRGAPGKFGRRNDNMMNNGGMDGQGGGGMMPNNGMTPQAMAQAFQRMQQYMQMMQMQQQQMAMNQGMNPMMAQMMRMQQMAMMAQQGGQGGGNNPMGNMNPQQMQQMMMQAQKQMQQGQGQGGSQTERASSAGAGGSQQDGDEGDGSGTPNTAANAGGDGEASSNSNANNIGSNQNNMMNNQHMFNAYQQQMFEAQKYGNRQNKGGFGGGNMAPTSWEGMYDDVPPPQGMGGGGRGGFRGGRGGGGGGNFQQQQHQQPNNAPANAPTGPKNAGRPGANYRGGGRGGNRGYHPYGRG